MGFRYGAQTKFFALLVFIVRPRSICANDTITQSKKLSVGETIFSPGKSFELGFFTPSNSSRQYIGIWYKSASYRKVVWVANRESPIQASDSASSLEIGEDGNLRLLDGMRNHVWWTNVSVSVQSNKTIAVLLDNGDLTLRDNVSGLILWESFNYPCDTFLPGMILGLNTKTGDKHFLTSWKNEDDPSPGEFVVGLTPERPPQAFIWNGSEPYWRGGPWDGGKFIGIEDAGDSYTGLIKLQPDNQQGKVYLVMDLYDSSYYAIMFITETGSLQILVRDEDTQLMYLNWAAPVNPCEVYGYCGPFGVCTKNRSRMCQCLKGFVPKSIEDWRDGKWGGGCVRRAELLCQNNISDTSVKAKSNGFWRLERAKLPDHFQYFFDMDAVDCQKWCASNCSCLAYALAEKIGCMVWTGDLIDLQQYSSRGDDLFIRLAHSELGNGNKKGKLIASFTTISAVIIFMGGLIYGLRRRSATQRAKRYIRTSRSLSLDDMTRAPRNASRENAWPERAIDEESSDFPVFEFEKILVATNNFSIENKLGEGGFGSVYKGNLENGQEIAVKRLSIHSGQGDQEFRNEIILISKLQHRNLVRLLGCCVEGEEKLLVYEYMTNKSLDSFLFDTERRMQLSWVKRVEIIQGIARGLQYLHRDSRLRVIHRDLKASNILLDNEMNPKISDFGLARIFQATQELANTHRVVGTFGYMSPEYAMGGLFSEKSDVYSFGVLLLEIVSGTKNTSFYNHKCLHLLGYAWQLWEEKRGLDLLDQALVGSYAAGEVMRCIQIGLLCVQDQAADRPTMPGVVVMLSSETEVPQPKKPTFTFQSLVNSDLLPVFINTCSKNEMSTSIIEGR